MSSTPPVTTPPSFLNQPLVSRGNQRQPEFSQRLAPYAVKTEENGENHSAFKKASVLFAPALSLLGGFGLLSGAILERKSNALKAVVGRAVSKAEAERVIKRSNHILSLAFFFGAYNDTLSGITNKQPSMLFSGLLQFIPASLLALNHKKIPKAFIYNLWTLLAAFWTVGFSNDMVHKEFSKNNEKPRQYDMARFVSAFRPADKLPFTERLATIGTEAKHMLGFVVEDHVRLAKSFFHKDKPIAAEKRNHTDWKKILEPSVSVTRLSVALTYLGAIPAVLWLLLARRAEPRLLEIPTGILRSAALVLANLSFFDLALHQKDVRGKMPLLGAPLAALGVLNPSHKYLQASVQLGEGLNSLFVSDVALKGMPKNKQKTGNTQTPANQSADTPPYHEHHQKAYRRPGNNEIRNGGIRA